MFPLLLYWSLFVPKITSTQLTSVYKHLHLITIPQNSHCDCHWGDRVGAPHHPQSAVGWWLSSIKVQSLKLLCQQNQDRIRPKSSYPLQNQKQCYLVPQGNLSPGSRKKTSHLLLSSYLSCGLAHPLLIWPHSNVTNVTNTMTTGQYHRNDQLINHANKDIRPASQPTIMTTMKPGGWTGTP